MDGKKFGIGSQIKNNIIWAFTEGKEWLAKIILNILQEIHIVKLPQIYRTIRCVVSQHNFLKNQIQMST
jgi:hypothetical protein